MQPLSDKTFISLCSDKKRKKHTPLLLCSSRIQTVCTTSLQSWSCLKTSSVSGRSSGPTSSWTASSSTAPNRWWTSECVCVCVCVCVLPLAPVPEVNAKMQVLLIRPGDGVPGGSGGNPDQTERRDTTGAGALQRPSRQGYDLCSCCFILRRFMRHFHTSVFCLFASANRWRRSTWTLTLWRGSRWVNYLWSGDSLCTSWETSCPRWADISLWWH